MFSSRTPADLAPNALAELLAQSSPEAPNAAADAAPDATPAASPDAAGFIDLTVSNPTAVALPGLAQVRERVAQALAEGARAPYRPDPRGLLSAREAVCAYLAARGHDIDPGHIVLTASTSESYSYLFKLLCDPGDEVAIPSPSYPLFAHLAELEGVAVRAYPAGGVPAPSARTRAIITVSPNNPTGGFLERPQRDALEDLAAGPRPLAIIGDEVFADYIHDPADAARYASVLGCERALSFGLGGLSKAAGLPQLKLGWIALRGPDALRDEALTRLEHIADTYLSVATPVQAALPALLRLGAEIRAAIAARVRENLAHLHASRVRARRLRVLPSPAGWYALLRLPLGRDDEATATELMRAARVHVYPGYYFDLPSDIDDAYLVLSLLPAPALFAAGVERLAAHL